MHVVIMLDANDTSEKQRADDLARCLAEYAISLGGTCTGEHGIGCGKMKLLEIEMGEGMYQCTVVLIGTQVHEYVCREYEVDA